MADQVAIQIPKTRYLEGSAFTATAVFRDRATGTASAPTTVEYSVYNRDARQRVVGWTLVSAASSVSITIDAGVNRIRLPGSRRERLEIIVLADRGLATETSSVRRYSIQQVEADVTADTSVAANVTYSVTEGRLVRAPVADSNPQMELPVASGRANQLLGFDAAGNVELYAPGSGGGGATLSRQVIGGYLWPQTASELADGVTPTDLAYEPGNVMRYGADSTGVSDSTTAFQAAIDSDYMVIVPPGQYRITSELTVTTPKIIEFAGGRSMRTYFNQQLPSSPTDSILPGEQARLMIEGDINVFNISCEQVYIYGGCFDCSNITDHTKAVFYYQVITNGDLVGGSEYGGWQGGAWNWMVLGNYEDVGQEGIGTTAVFVDPASSTVSNSYLYFHDWQGTCYACQYGFRASGRPAGKGITLNNCSVDIQANSTLQAFRNESIKNMIVRVRHQGRRVFESESEVENNASIYNIYEAHYEQCRFYDFGQSPSGGRYTNQKSWEIYEASSFSELDQAGRAIKIVQKKTREVIDNAIAFAPTFKTTQYSKGLWIPQLHDIFGPWANQAAISGTLTIAAYEGQGIATSTAVSDCVFANQSGQVVEITSAGGNLPSLNVGALFDLSDHSDSDNNGLYVVDSTVTDGYSCTKQERDISYTWSPEPNDAASEAVTVDTGFGAITTDSATAGISTSSDITLTNTDNLFSSKGVGTSAEWNAQAVTDGDYVEIYVSGGARQMSKLWVYVGNIDDHKNDYVQCLRYTTDPVDNIVVAPSDLLEGFEARTRYYEFDLGGSSLSKAVIRLAGLDSAGSIQIHGIWAGHSYPQFDAPSVQRDDPGDMYGAMQFQAGGVGMRTETTTNLNDSSHEVNTSDYKVAGFCVFDTTANIPMYATGNGDTDTWVGEKAGSTITLTPS